MVFLPLHTIRLVVVHGTGSGFDTNRRVRDRKHLIVEGNSGLKTHVTGDLRVEFCLSQKNFHFVTPTKNSSKFLMKEEVRDELKLENIKVVFIKDHKKVDVYSRPQQKQTYIINSKLSTTRKQLVGHPHIRT